ncbi:MAG: hypothetical protein LBT22_08045 [Peptococcaceae bacterium]|nr:hypothetical protein [Peptococcaceae bacterium]
MKNGFVGYIPLSDDLAETLCLLILGVMLMVAVVSLCHGFVVYPLGLILFKASHLALL